MHHIVCLQCTTLSPDTLRLQKCKEAVIKRRDSLVRELAGLTLQLVLQVELYSSPRNLQRILYGRTSTRDTFARFVDNVSGVKERKYLQADIFSVKLFGWSAQNGMSSRSSRTSSRSSQEKAVTCTLPESEDYRPPNSSTQLYSWTHSFTFVRREPGYLVGELVLNIPTWNPTARF